MGASCRSKEGEKGGKKGKADRTKKYGSPRSLPQKDEISLLFLFSSKENGKGWKKRESARQTNVQKVHQRRRETRGGAEKREKVSKVFLAPTTKRGRDDDSDSMAREKQQHKKSIIIILKNVRFKQRKAIDVSFGPWVNNGRVYDV